MDISAISAKNNKKKTEKHYKKTRIRTLTYSVKNINNCK